MDGLVLDASVAMTWCYPDERSDYAYRVLDSLEHGFVIVPGHWRLEVANAVISGERKGRLPANDVARFLSLIDDLPVSVDPQTSARSLSDTLNLARRYKLTSYDAAYLEVAMRENLVLATLDVALRKAAAAAGVNTFKAR